MARWTWGLPDPQPHGKTDGNCGRTKGLLLLNAVLTSPRPRAQLRQRTRRPGEGRHRTRSSADASQRRARAVVLVLLGANSHRRKRRSDRRGSRHLIGKGGAIRPRSGKKSSAARRSRRSKTALKPRLGARADDRLAGSPTSKMGGPRESTKLGSSLAGNRQAGSEGRATPGSAR